MRYREKEVHVIIPEGVTSIAISNIVADKYCTCYYYLKKIIFDCTWIFVNSIDWGQYI